METPKYGTLIECIIEDNDGLVSGMFSTGDRSNCFNMIRICEHSDPVTGAVLSYAGLAYRWRYPGETEWRR